MHQVLGVWREDHRIRQDLVAVRQELLLHIKKLRYVNAIRTLANMTARAA